MEHIMKDERFKHIKSDPRFRSMARQQRKVKIDERFKTMFTDKAFKVKYSVDKRGKPQNYTTNENLKKYYDLTSSEDDEEGEENVKDDEEKEKSENDEESEGSEESEDTEESDDEEVVNKNVKNEVESTLKLEKAKFDYARGEGNVESSSSSEDESEEEDEDNELVHPWGELANAKTTEESTRRLAVCSIDWDRIGAQDIYFLCKSFLPPGGIIKSVKVYLSDFGRQRLELEEVKGPAELIEAGGRSNDDAHRKNSDEDPEGEKFHMEQLRKYQLNRLNYYYAVVECDDAETASKLYEECDGLEFESSASKLDLRYIPDDMEFDHEAHQFADVTLDGSTYRPKYFTTTALQSSKVNLTWDETNPNRLEVIKRAFEEGVEGNNEIDDYLASSSEDEEENVDKAVASSDSENEEEAGKSDISKYRNLLLEIEQKEEEKKKKDVHMEISWGPGLKEKAEKLVQEKVKESQPSTVWEEHLQKRKEKRIEKLKLKKETLKKAEEKEDEKLESGEENPYSDDDIPSDVDLEDAYFQEELNTKKNKRKDLKGKDKKLGKGKVVSQATEQEKAELALLMDDGNDNKKHFTLKKLMEKANGKKKRKNKMKKDKVETEDGFEINLDDDRFGALYSSHLYNIDPSDQNFKKTKGIEKVMEEKQKRRLDQDHEQQSDKKLKTDNTVKSSAKLKEKAELSSLIKSVKNKTQSFGRNVKKFS